MAYDKVVDSSVLDAGLKQIANAIRTKGGTTGNLAFPTGMADAISAIETGSGGGGTGNSDAAAVLDALIDGSITEITSNATRIDAYAFHTRDKLTKVCFPEATEIDTYGVYKCIFLAEVHFPKLTTVGSQGLGSNFNLRYADFPCLTQIKTKAFRYCWLRSLVLRNTTMCTLDNADAIDETDISYEVGYIYVPSALLDTYKAATNWSTYATQFRALEDYTVDGTITGELDPNKAGNFNAAGE